MWDLGDTVPLGFTVTDDQGELVNATSVALVITLPDGTALGSPPAVTNPSTGRYAADYVPAVAGLHLIRWTSVGPATAFADVVDVRDDTFVVSLADAKAHLNQTTGRTGTDEELRPILLAAGERVARHLGIPELSAAITASQRLAVLEVVCEYWSRSQRTRYGGSRAGYGGSSAEDEPQLPLKARLVDLLGEPVPQAKATPQGAFPAPLGWPC